MGSIIMLKLGMNLSLMYKQVKEMAERQAHEKLH
jgi:hypothetical protein